MTATAEQQFTQLYDIARTAARQVAPAHQGFTTEDDLAQDGILWLLEHPERVGRATLPDGTLFFNRLVGEVAKQLVRSARKERERAGQLVREDRFAYSVRMVEIVLPAVFDSNHRPPQLDTRGMPRAETDPAALTNWQVLVADVRRAVEAVCDAVDRRILFARSVGGWTWAKFGENYEHSGEWHRQRYHEALRRISAHLSDGVVLESDLETEAISEAMDDPELAPYLDGDSTEDEWHLIGKDPYREPEW